MAARKSRRRAKKTVKKKYLAKPKEIKKEIKEKPKQGIFSWFIDHYVMVMFIPMVLLILALIVITIQTSTTGNLLWTGVSLSGGTEVSIPASLNVSSNGIVTYFRKNFVHADTRIREIYNFGKPSHYLLDTTLTNVSEIKQALIKYNPKFKGAMQELSFRTVGAELGRSFFKQIVVALFIAFFFMALVVVWRFKTFIPSLAVILSAFSDITLTVAFLDLLHYRVSTGGIAALLMLIGYSVDTDILLSTRMLKGKGSYAERLRSSFLTGITMTLTTLVTVFLVYIATNSIVIKEIMFIIGIGLFADILNTWFQNAGLLVWYVKRKRK